MSRGQRLLLALALALGLARAGLAQREPDRPRTTRPEAASPAAEDLPQPGELPLLGLDGQESPSRPAPAGDINDPAQAAPLAPAPLDEDVHPAQQAAPAEASPAGTAPVPYAGEPSAYPTGPQSAGVTVQVVAPAAMTLNKPATVTILVKNNGTADALGVVARDQLPPGTEVVRCLPEATASGNGFLSWNLGTLSAGQEKKLAVTVKPTAKGPQDHAATVTLSAGSRAKTVVREPILHVEQAVSKTTVLKGQQVKFDITIVNDGDGPARNVLVRADLSTGLREGTQGNVLELDLAQQYKKTALAPQESIPLPPIFVDAVASGEQTCTVKVTSPDVVADNPKATSVKSVTVTEPILRLTLDGSRRRPTDTVAEYTLTVVNEGTAPAQNVRLTAALVGDGRRFNVPGATWDGANRKWIWTLPTLEANGKPQTFPFRVQLGGVGVFQVNAEATANGGHKEVKSLSTTVEGMADLDMQLTEELRVLDVGQETVFYIRIRNLGTKEATAVQVRARLSPNLEVVQTGGTDDKAVLDGETVVFPLIERIPRGGDLALGIRVKAKAAGRAQCRAFVSHKELVGEPLEDVTHATITDVNPPQE